MSDHDLRNLYENVRRGDEYNAPLGITQLYNEMWGINDTQPVPGIVPGTDEQTPNFGQRRTPQQDNAIKELIEDWVESAGYSNLGGQVTALVKSAVDGYIDWQALWRFVSSKEKNSTSLPVERGLIDIREILENQLKKFVDVQYVENVYTTLFAAAFAESTVAVGRGELIITLLTSCTKGQVGDVEFMSGEPSDGIRLGPEKNSVQVEVKTGRGRAISGRGGGFRNANIAIEAAIMGSVVVDPEHVASGQDYKVIGDDGLEVMVTPVTKTVKGKEKIIGFEPVNETAELLTIPQFIQALKQADAHMGKHNWFKDNASELAKLLAVEEKNRTPEECRVIRHYASLACMLLGYSNRGEHFKYLLLVKQSGKNATTKIPAAMDADSFRQAAFVDCSTLRGIYNQMKGDGPLHMDRGGRYTDGGGGNRKALDGEGVYIGYKGSNTNIDGLAGFSTYSSDRNRISQANALKQSTKKTQQ